MIKEAFYNRVLNAEEKLEKIKRYPNVATDVTQLLYQIAEARTTIAFVFGDNDAEIDANLKRLQETGTITEQKPIEEEFDPMYIPILRGLISYHERLRLVAETESPGEGMNDLYLGAIKLSLRLMEERFGSTG